MEETLEEVPEKSGSEEQVSEELAPDVPESGQKAAVTINIQSWATPIIALLMLVIGFFAGFYLRPGAASVQNQAAVAQVSTPEQPTTDPAANDQLVAFLSSQERHTLGDPNAPVTIFGFSDFQ